MSTNTNKLDVTRYDPIRHSDMGGWSWDVDSIRSCDDGEYVKFDDYSELLAQRDRAVELLVEWRNQYEGIRSTVPFTVTNEFLQSLTNDPT